MQNIKTVWCWWWGWSPEKIENLLEQMESKKMWYCVDYQLNVDENYFNLFKDDGWELVCDRACGWYIWSKAYTNERPNIYTDTKSLVERNKTLVRVISSIFAAQIPLFSPLFVINNGEKISRLTVLIAIWIFIFIFEGYAIIQLNRYIKKQHNSIKE